MSNNILNETFQRHLALLKKKLNEADQQGELPLSGDGFDKTEYDNSQQKKENFWNDYKTMGVKSFVNRYGKLFSDPKFHAFISAGLADKIDDESFNVTQVSPLVTTLTPTQMEIGFGNSLNDLIKPMYNEGVQLVELDKMLKGDNVKLKAKTGEVPMVIFNNKYIIDGHHRWSKIYCANKNATVFCLNFECPSLENDPSMALKAFHLAIAKMLKQSPTEDKSGKNLFNATKVEVFKYVREYLILPSSKQFLDVYKKYSNLINSNLNEAEQLYLIDPKTTLNANIDPFVKTVSLYIANNAQALISNSTPATNTPRSHMPQTDRAPGYEDALEKGEINFLPDKVTEKMVNETFQRHLKLLHKKLNLNENMSIEDLATVSDEALDNAYHYGRSTPGNTFGWQANLKSAEFAKRVIDSGVTDIEKISDAIHSGWNETAKKFVANPDQFSDTQKLRDNGKFDAKIEQRRKLSNVNYSSLPEEEKEKDRVVARALLNVIQTP